MPEKINNIQAGFLAALLFDVEDALQRQTSNDIPTHRRGLIRTLIAAVEGMAWVYREHILAIATEMEEISDREKTALSEVVVAVDEQGRISEQKRYLSTIATIRLTTRLARKFTLNCDPDFGDGGWSDLRETFALRNRLSHPKRSMDLQISSEDVARAVSAFHWLSGVVVSVMTRSNVAFRRDVDAISEVLNPLKAGDPEMLALYRKINEGSASADSFDS